MARSNRSKIVRRGEVQIFHAISRCVRQLPLLAEEQNGLLQSKRRRRMIDQHTMDLAKYFLIDILASALLSNHMHHVLRTRPDLVKGLSDREVARRWLGTCPKKRDENGDAIPATEKDIDKLLKDKKKFSQLRERLSSVSWFMRILKQRIGRLANLEDYVVGRFWAGRFRLIELKSEESVIACCVYLDLNQVRAGMAKTPEESEFSSFYYRIVALRSRQYLKKRGLRPPPKIDPYADSWLAPIFRDSLPKNFRYADDGFRASDKTAFGMTLAQYMNLVDWTARLVRKDKPAAMNAKISGIFERLGISPEEWQSSIRAIREWDRRLEELRRGSKGNTGSS